MTAKKGDSYRTLEIWFIGAALFVSAITTGLSGCAIKAAKESTAAQAKYSMLRDAEVVYVQGHAAFTSAINTVRDDLPFDIEEPSVVNNLTLADLEKLRSVVRPIVEANHAYEASFRSTIAAWPRAVRGTLVTEADNGLVIGTCYEQAAMRALDETEAKQVRENLNRWCRNLGNVNKVFEASSRSAYVEMANEVHNAAVFLGADPEKIPPEPTPKASS